MQFSQCRIWAINWNSRKIDYWWNLRRNMTWLSNRVTAEHDLPVVRLCTFARHRVRLQVKIRIGSGGHTPSKHCVSHKIMSCSLVLFWTQIQGVRNLCLSVYKRISLVHFFVFIVQSWSSVLLFPIKNWLNNCCVVFCLALISLFHLIRRHKRAEL